MSNEKEKKTPVEPIVDTKPAEESSLGGVNATLSPDKEKFDVGELLGLIKAQGKQIEALTAVADKAQLAAYNNRGLAEQAKKVQLSVLNHEGVNKVVLGWRSTANEVFQDPMTGRIIEKQNLEIMFDDGTKYETTFLDWVRRSEKIDCILVGKIEENGTLAYKLKRMDTGKEYIVDVAFVN